VLTFWQRYHFEDDGFDGGRPGGIPTTAPGKTWGIDFWPTATTVPSPPTITIPLAGRRAWVDDLDTWAQVKVDLSGYAGYNSGFAGASAVTSLVATRAGSSTILSFTPLRARSGAGCEACRAGVGIGRPRYPGADLGSGFAGTPAVKLGSTWLAPVTVVDAETLQVVVPGSMATGFHPLVVYNGDCQEAMLNNAFWVLEGALDNKTYLPLIVESPFHEQTGDRNNRRSWRRARLKDSR